MPCRTYDLSGLCGSGADVINRCVFNIKGQRFALFNKFAKPFMRRISRSVYNAGQQELFAAFNGTRFLTR